LTHSAGCPLISLEEAHFHVARGSALNHRGGIDIVVNAINGSQARAGGFAALG
jgi:hypothetical protein